MIERIRQYWLRKKWRKRQAEAIPFVLLVLALIDGALVSETLSIIREYLQQYDDALFFYKLSLISLTILMLGLTSILCQSWTKPLDEVANKLKKK